jgi:hypothetical protein
VTAVRLEVLPDPSLPRKGPGRFPGNGNFHLNGFRMAAGGEAVALSGVAVSYAEDESYRHILDGSDDAKFWGVWHREGQAHTAVFRPDPARKAGGELSFELRFSQQHGLGCFRLGFSTDPATFGRERLRLEGGKHPDPWCRLAAGYQLAGDRRALERLLERHPTAADAIGDP